MACAASASSAWCLRPTLRPRRHPPSAVMSDLGAGVVDAVGQRLGREAPEDDGERRPDPGAGEHRDGQLGDHGHVDRDSVAGLDARAREARWRPGSPRPGGRGGDRPRVARLADPVVGDLVAEPALHVPIHAVVGDVERPASEPPREGELPFQGGLERRDPADPLAGLGRPERLRIALGLLVEGARRVRPGDEGGVGRERPLLEEQGLDLGLGRRAGRAARRAPPWLRGMAASYAGPRRRRVLTPRPGRAPAPRPGAHVYSAPPSASAPAPASARGSRDHDGSARGQVDRAPRRNASRARRRSSPAISSRSPGRTVAVTRIGMPASPQPPRRRGGRGAAR